MKYVSGPYFEPDFDPVLDRFGTPGYARTRAFNSSLPAPFCIFPFPNLVKILSFHKVVQAGFKPAEVPFKKNYCFFSSVSGAIIDEQLCVAHCRVVVDNETREDCTLVKVCFANSSIKMPALCNSICLI